jgi:hypothetical protein
LVRFIGINKNVVYIRRAKFIEKIVQNAANIFFKKLLRLVLNQMKLLFIQITPTQNGYLRIVSGAYRATPARYLESEMAVPPFDLYLDKWVADFEHRIGASGISQLLRAAGARAAEMVAGRRRQHKRRAPELTSRDQRIQAVRRWMGIKKDTEEVMLEAWRRRWREATRVMGQDPMVKGVTLSQDTSCRY